MIKLALNIGAVLILFADIIFRAFPYVYPVIKDTREQRNAIGLYLALFIGLLALWQYGFQKGRNKWIIILVGYCFLSSSFWWSMPLAMNNIEMTSFWKWYPLFAMMCYFLMFLGITQQKFEKKDIFQLTHTLVWCGIVMGCYIVCQFFGIDQFATVKPFKVIGWGITNPHLIGTLGQPTLVAPFIAIIVPMALFLKKPIVALFLALIVFTINSQVATVALILSMLVYFTLSNPKRWIITVMILIGGYFLFRHINPDIISAGNGRFQAWGHLIDAWKNGPFPDKPNMRFCFFGVGLGSFGYYFHEIFNTNYYQAHCEPLEVLISLGLVGFGLYIIANCSVLYEGFIAYKNNLDWHRRLFIALLSSFVCLSLVSCGTFIYQLGVYQFLTVIIVGLICNNSLQWRKK